MSRLVVFGCSHTYGHGLRDCYDPLTGHPGPQPSLQAWPARLVELLRQTHDPNISLVNNSSPGASNKEIMHNILLFDFKENDICVIMWTYADRWSIFEGKGSKWRTTRQLLPMFDDSKEYYRHFHNDFDSNYSMWQNINHAKLLLDSLDIPNWHCHVHKTEFLQAYPPQWNNVDVILTDFTDWKTQNRACDGSHAGPKAHKKHANELKVIIDAYYK